MRSKAHCPFCGYARELLDGLSQGPETHILAHDPVLRVMTIRPLAPAVEGHVMLVPYEHVSPAVTSDESSPYSITHALERVARVAARAAETWGTAYNLVLQAGEAGGQSVEHLHLHYVPRRFGDDLGYRWPGQH